MGAIDPFVERPGRAVDKYPPPIVVVVGGEYNGVDIGRSGKGAIDPFSKRLVRCARSDGKSHANGVMLPLQCGGGGKWDNGSINVQAKSPVHQAKAASIWSNFRDIFGVDNREWSRQAIQQCCWCRWHWMNCPVGQYPPSNFLPEGEYDGVDAANGAGEGAIDPFSERSRGRAWADGIRSIAIRLYSPPIVLAEGKVDGVDAASWAGGGAIDPFAEWLNGLARADGIGGAAVALYSPPMVAEVEEEYFVLLH